MELSALQSFPDFFFQMHVYRKTGGVFTVFDVYFEDVVACLVQQCAL